MRARLGFAVLEQHEPDILLLDEVHEAIDEGFRRRLESLAAGLRERGGIVVAAGHDHPQLMRLCDRQLALESSGLTGVGAPPPPMPLRSAS
jgi:ABC-type polysaccharide/polyol phosphate transport system ATPase subunit